MNHRHRAGLARWLPILDWAALQRQVAGEDLLAAIIVALMLIPQALVETRQPVETRHLRAFGDSRLKQTWWRQRQEEARWKR